MRVQTEQSTGSSVRTISAPQAGDALERAVRVPALRTRVLGWLTRPEIRAALVATLVLRLATSGFAALVVTVLHDVYVRTVAAANINGRALGIFIVPAPLQGPAAYLTGPWMRWDANFYPAIAFQGYAQEGWSAFLPLYPALIRATSVFTGGHAVAAALLVSTVATFACFVSLYRLTERLTGSADAARLSLATACLLPVAFVLMAPYTEALFLAFSLAAIQAALDRRWLLAALLAVLASLTRQQGVLLSALAIPELWQVARRVWAERRAQFPRWRALWQRTWRPLLLVITPPITYGVWLLVLVVLAHQPTPTQLLTSSNGWRQHFTVPGVGVVVDLIILIAQPARVLLHHVDIALDAVSTVVAGSALVIVRRRLPPGLLMYLGSCWCAAVVKVTPIWTTNSASRYLLALLPLCFLPGIWLARAHPIVRIAWMTVCASIAAWVFLDWMLWAWVV